MTEARRMIDRAIMARVRGDHDPERLKSKARKIRADIHPTFDPKVTSAEARRRGIE